MIPFLRGGRGWRHSLGGERQQHETTGKSRGGRGSYGRARKCKSQDVPEKGAVLPGLCFSEYSYAYVEPRGFIPNSTVFDRCHRALLVHFRDIIMDQQRAVLVSGGGERVPPHTALVIGKG